MILSARALNRDLLVVGRAGTPSAEEKLALAGADRIVSPYTMAGRRLAELAIRPRVVDFLDAALSHGELSFSLEELHVTAGGSLDGATVAALRGRGLFVLAVLTDGGRYEANPPDDRRLLVGETIIGSGSAEAFRAARDEEPSGPGRAGARGGPWAPAGRWPRRTRPPHPQRRTDRGPRRDGGPRRTAVTSELLVASVAALAGLLLVLALAAQIARARRRARRRAAEDADLAAGSQVAMHRLAWLTGRAADAPELPGRGTPPAPIAPVGRLAARVGRLPRRRLWRDTSAVLLAGVAGVLAFVTFLPPAARPTAASWPPRSSRRRRPPPRPRPPPRLPAPPRLWPRRRSDGPTSRRPRRRRHRHLPRPATPVAPTATPAPRRPAATTRSSPRPTLRSTPTPTAGPTPTRRRRTRPSPRPRPTSHPGPDGHARPRAPGEHRPTASRRDGRTPSCGRPAGRSPSRPSRNP